MERLYWRCGDPEVPQAGQMSRSECANDALIPTLRAKHPTDGPARPRTRITLYCGHICLRVAGRAVLENLHGPSCRWASASDYWASRMPSVKALREQIGMRKASATRVGSPSSPGGKCDPTTAAIQPTSPGDYVAPSESIARRHADGRAHFRQRRSVIPRGGADGGRRCFDRGRRDSLRCNGT